MQQIHLLPLLFSFFVSEPVMVVAYGMYIFFIYIYMMSMRVLCMFNFQQITNESLKSPLNHKIHNISLENMKSLACFKVEFMSAINQELSNQSECRRSYQILVGERKNKARSYKRQTSRCQVLQNSQSAHIYTTLREPY
jgi:hypothetical protein